MTWTTTLVSHSYELLTQRSVAMWPSLLINILVLLISVPAFVICNIRKPKTVAAPPAQSAAEKFNDDKVVLTRTLDSPELMAAPPPKRPKEPPPNVPIAEKQTDGDDTLQEVESLKKEEASEA
uniref:Transmembrane protein n=1 Tax=Steinernema glaseri TaxID=37863 RepID=A0A1I7XX47_9BILA